jgi:hypothetical protein
MASQESFLRSPTARLSSFAENPELSSSGMNAQVAAVTNNALKGFLLPPSHSTKID